MKSLIHTIRYPPAVDSGFGRLAEEANYGAHVEQLILQVLMTGPGERINRPDFGCGIRQMVFAPNSETAASLAQVSAYQALTRWLGSVIEVSQVEVEAVEAVLIIKIAYILKAQMERRYLNVEIPQ